MMTNGRMQHPVVPGGLIRTVAAPASTSSHNMIGHVAAGVGTLAGDMPGLLQQSQQLLLQQQQLLSFGPGGPQVTAVSEAGRGVLSGAFGADLGGFSNAGALVAGQGGPDSVLGPYRSFQAPGGMVMASAAGAVTAHPAGATATGSGRGMGAGTVGMVAANPGSGAYGMGAGLSAMATAAVACATGMTTSGSFASLSAAGGASGHSSRGQGWSVGLPHAAGTPPRLSCRRDVETGSSDPEAALFSDSGTSDGDNLVHKSNKRKRECGGAGGDEHLKLLARKEKNRMAQKRHREKAKTMLVGLQVQLGDIFNKVLSLKAQNEALRRDTAVLEKALEMHSEEIQRMQKEKEGHGPVPELATSLGSDQVWTQLPRDAVEDLLSQDFYRAFRRYIKELSVRKCTEAAAAAAASYGDGGGYAPFASPYFTHSMADNTVA